MIMGKEDAQNVGDYYHQVDYLKVTETIKIFT